ncbi:MAG: hypothetical protein ACRCXZ_05250 [Patescibacteria group bacterium]
MAISQDKAALFLQKNWDPGNTFVVLMEIPMSDKLQKKEDFQSMLTKVKSEIQTVTEDSQGDNGLFSPDASWSLGGFDIQIATAGAKDNLILAALGGSCTQSMIESANPIEKGFSFIPPMLNTYFDKKYVLSEEVKPGEFEYKIKAVQIGQQVLYDGYNEAMENGYIVTEKASPVFDYPRQHGDVFWDYYVIDAIGEVVELTANIAITLLENGPEVSTSILEVTPELVESSAAIAESTTTLAEPAFPAMLDILPSTDAPIVGADGVGDAVGSTAESFGFIGDAVGSCGDAAGSFLGSCGDTVSGCDGAATGCDGFGEILGACGEGCSGCGS